MVTCATDGAFRPGRTLLNAGRFLHSGSYGADALFAGGGQCGYGPRELFHATGAQHSRLGPSWPWYERVPWLRSPHAFKRSHSLCARQLSRHGEDEGCRQGTGSSRISSSNYAAETAGWAFWGILSFLMKTARSCRESSPGPRPCRHRRPMYSSGSGSVRPSLHAGVRKRSRHRHWDCS